MKLKKGDSAPQALKPLTQSEIVSAWQDKDAKPKVTIVCHTFNHEEYIEAAISGFLAQVTTFPFEIIIHDDASTDGTIKIINYYADKYPKLIRKIIQNENQYSKGIRPSFYTFPASRGEYIALCEGDDYWTDNGKLQKQSDLLDKNLDVSVVYHNAYRVHDGKVLGALLRDEYCVNYSQRDHQSAPFIPTLTRMLRRFDYEWSARRNFPTAGDVCLSAYAARFGGAAYIDSVTPAVYRVHEGGVWSRRTSMDKIRVTVDACLFVGGEYGEEGNENLQNKYIGRTLFEILRPFSVLDRLKIVVYVFEFFIKRFFNKKIRSVKRRLW
ncbi:MAG: hypothetical protein C0618_00165 [Desulfuromonas sp.]|nr:MAG: hypothetical protein C0618_00165 [Desulfuromonas sp.]